ncbi:MAG: bifunctional riboflavin kinase/FMN adenylyltransferase [Phycisphaerales bacterium]
MSTPTAITIGTFDGVHIGHAALVQRCREHVGVDGRVIVLSFDPHPTAVLAKDRVPPRLTTQARRVELLKGLTDRDGRPCGADEVVILEPSRELLAQSPERFIEGVVERHRPSVIVEGPDFGFGKGRTGSVGTLRELGPRFVFEVDVVEPVQQALRDQTLVRASSTVVRWLVGEGRVRDAALVLGRPFELPGSVVKGDQRGREIGIPTANIVSACMSPGDGVYAAIAHLPGGRTHAAAVNIGERPTFEGLAHRIEAHLLDVGRPSGDAAWAPLPGLPEYGWDITLELIGWVRDQVRFGSPGELVAQIQRDIERVRAIVGPVGPTRGGHLQGASA